MTNLLLLSGSQRRESYNTKLLQYLSKFLDGRCTVDLIDSTKIDLPIFNQDLENDPLIVNRVALLHQRFHASHGIVVSCPEFNGQLTPFLKNIIDWVSRLSYINNQFENPFQSRPVLLCSASTGWSGGAVSTPYARALFGYVGCLVIGETICIPHADQAWSNEGYQFDPFFESHIHDATVRAFSLAQDFAQKQIKQQKDIL